MTDELNRPLAWMDAVDAARTDLVEQLRATYDAHALPLSHAEANAAAARLLPVEVPSAGWHWDRPASEADRQRELSELEEAKTALQAEANRGQGRFWTRASLAIAGIGGLIGWMAWPVLGLALGAVAALVALFMDEARKDRILRPVMLRVWTLEEWVPIPEEGELDELAAWLNQPTLRAHLIALRHSGVPLLAGDFDALRELAEKLADTEPQRQMLDMIDRAAAQPSSEHTP